MSMGRQSFVFLFRPWTEQPHRGDMNTMYAIPNTAKGVCFQVLSYLDVCRVFYPSV